MDASLTNGSPQPVTSAGGRRQTARNGLSWDTVHPSPRHITSSGFWPTGYPALARRRSVADRIPH
eukprot:8370762-Pyramimonas_sp.AAC.1